MTDAELQDKLRKLLRLSGSPNQHEAQLALQKAQELAMKHGYSLSDLETATTQEVLDVPVDDERGNAGISTASSMLASMLAPFFRVKVYQKRNGKYSTMAAIGLPKDVTSFTLSYQFTINSFETLWKIYNKQNPSPYARRMRNDFLIGFIAGCKERLTIQSQEYGIMIVTPDAVMKRYHEKFPARREWPRKKQRFSYITTAGDSHAFHAGVRGGKNLGNNQLHD